MEQDSAQEPAEQGSRPDDLPPEAVEAAKKRSRINALTLAAVFLLLTFAPRPWNVYAPVLFLIPVIYALVGRIRAASTIPGPSSTPLPSAPPPGSDAPVTDPYSYTPRDPKDPRRYKPIG